MYFKPRIFRVDLSKPVQTRDGRKVANIIPYFDQFMHEKLLGLIYTDKGTAIPQIWCKNGDTFDSGRKLESDLINVPEKKTLYCATIKNGQTLDYFIISFNSQQTRNDYLNDLISSSIIETFEREVTLLS